MANEPTVKTTPATSRNEDASPTAVAAVPAKKTLTNWKVFEDANFHAIQVKCDGYASSHPADLSCHSNVLPTTEAILRHMDPNHSGGWFKVKFRISDGKKSTLWAGLEEAGVELQHFYCPHCRVDVKVSPRDIVKHLQPHQGANRTALLPQTLCMTLGFQKADVDEYDSLYDMGN